MSGQLTESPKVDTKEFELPETTFVRDVENRVFQAIVLQCLAKIDGIGLVEGNFLDSILGRHNKESVKGIYAEQDSRNQAVSIRVEINIRYGLSIPEKAEEIQVKVADEVTKMTGLHVNQVHVVFKNLLHSDSTKELMSQRDKMMGHPISDKSTTDTEFSDEF